MNQETSHIQASDSKEQKEKQKMLSLQQKVESVKNLKRILDNLDLDMELGTVVTQLHDHFDEVKNQYPETAQRLTYLTNLQQTSEALRIQIQALNDRYGEDKVDDLMTTLVLHGAEAIATNERKVAEKISSFYINAEDIENEIDKLLLENNLQFLNSLQKGIDNAIRRFQEIKKLKKSPEDLKKGIGKMLGVPPEKEDEIRTAIVDVEFKPIAVTVVLESHFYNTYIGETTGGVHYLGTPLNFIKNTGNESEMAKYAAHEETHSYTDGFIDTYPGKKHYKTEFWVQSLKAKIETLDALMEQGIENEDFTIDIPYFGNIKNMIDSLHEEIIADFERLQESSVFLDPEKLKSNIVFTTAHNDALNAITGLNELKKIAKSPLLKKKLEDMFVDIKNHLNRIVAQMSNAYLIGNELKADKDVEALLVILKPSQYHYIKRHLIDKYGKEAYEAAEQKLKNLYKTEDKSQQKDENEEQEAA